jgi:hypothetical protein
MQPTQERHVGRTQGAPPVGLCPLMLDDLNEVVGAALVSFKGLNTAASFSTTSPIDGCAHSDEEDDMECLEDWGGRMSGLEQIEVVILTQRFASRLA